MTKNRNKNKINKTLPGNVFNYEKVNYVANDGDSVYAAPIDDLPGGQTYFSLDIIRDIVNEELDRRLGPSLNKNKNDY